MEIKYVWKEINCLFSFHNPVIYVVFKSSWPFCVVLCTYKILKFNVQSIKSCCCWQVLKRRFGNKRAFQTRFCKHCSTFSTKRFLWDMVDQVELYDNCYFMTTIILRPVYAVSNLLLIFDIRFWGSILNSFLQLILINHGHTNDVWLLNIWCYCDNQLAKQGLELIY